MRGRKSGNAGASRSSAIPVPAIAIGLAGLGGSGKGEVKDILLTLRPGETVHLRTIVEEELRGRGLPVTNRTLREEATRMREVQGPDALAERALPHVRAALERSPMVIVDSIKSMAEVVCFRAAIPQRFVVLAVEAAADLRFARLAARGLPWDMKDRASFDWRDKMESGWGTAEAVKGADYTIVNGGTRNDLARKVREFVQWLDKTARPKT
jgi:dephospho-CoA kinase